MGIRFAIFSVCAVIVLVPSAKAATPCADKVTSVACQRAQDAGESELQRQAAAEQSRLEQRAQRKLSQRARDNVRKETPLDPRWQKAVDEAKQPDFGSIFGTRVIALMLGSLWLGIIYRRWAANRRRRARA